METDQVQYLCSSHDLQEGGLAVPFDVNYAGLTCLAFAVRFEGMVYAYLNRCAHVAVEMDSPPNRFFDDTGLWLVCSSHGAMYRPDTGECVAGPCSGKSLVKITVLENESRVFWKTSWNLTSVEFL